jgi:3-deoxy-manno-octulosonate cytidylyltransferase (CMP-KDO synthetase)
MRVLCVIPARLGSTRLPNKPLQLLAGEPLVTRVARRVIDHDVVDRVVIASDAAEVIDAVTGVGLEAVLTGALHRNGTERVGEVAGMSEYQGYDAFVNVQGDEPFIDKLAVQGAIDWLAAGSGIGTAAAPLPAEHADDPARVKVVFDAQGEALYFSRAAIPHYREPEAGEPKHWQHVGVYAYTRRALERWVAVLPTPLEVAERLEQLRPLEHGMIIGVARLAEPVLPGIDTVEDLKLAEELWLTLSR